MPSYSNNNGSNANISPLYGRVILTSLKYKHSVQHKIIVDATAGALNGLLSLLTTVVQTYSIPLELGFEKSFDLQELAPIKEIHNVSAPTISLNLSLLSGALLLDESGVSFVGTVVDVSPELLASTVQQLRDMVKAEPESPSTPCPACQLTMRTISGMVPFGLLSVPDFQAFHQCQQDKISCELRKQIPLTSKSDQKQLTALQAHVLRKLKGSPSVDDQQLYALLAGLLRPAVSVGIPSGEITEDQFNKEYSAVQDKFVAARRKVDDDASLPNGKTVAAVRRDFLAATITRATQVLNLTANFSIPASDQAYDQTIRTDPAPNLNCGNQRGCKSDFQYDGFNPPGCPASCTHQECIFHLCTDVPDLGLCARKAACEADKEGQRVDYERRKAQAQAQFALEKADCERLKASERLGCEINQQWLNTTQSMDLGNVKGSAHIGTATGAVAIKSIKISPNLDTVQVIIDTTAHSQIDTAFAFTPLNAGHIACVAQWSGRVSAGIILNQSDFTLTAHLSPTGSPGNDGPSYSTDEATITVRSVPPPGVALLSQNPQMALACPVPAAMLVAFGSAAPPLGLVVEIKLLLKDDINIKVPSEKLPLSISIADSKDQPVHFDVTPKIGNNSIVVVAATK